VTLDEIDQAAQLASTENTFSAVPRTSRKPSLTSRWIAAVREIKKDQDDAEPLPPPIIVPTPTSEQEQLAHTQTAEYYKNIQEEPNPDMAQINPELLQGLVQLLNKKPTIRAPEQPPFDGRKENAYEFI
jgi:hypothetical protein